MARPFAALDPFALFAAQIARSARVDGALPVLARRYALAARFARLARLTALLPPWLTTRSCACRRALCSFCGNRTNGNAVSAGLRSVSRRLATPRRHRFAHPSSAAATLARPAAALLLRVFGLPRLP